MSWLSDRLAEKSSQVALGYAIVATGGVAANPASWTHEGVGAWMVLIPIWAAAIVHILLPDALPPLPASAPASAPAAVVATPPAPVVAAVDPQSEHAALARSLGVPTSQ